jgi:hypothetical protein
VFVLWTQNLNSHHELIAGGGLHDFDIGLPNRFLVEIQQGSYRIAEKGTVGSQTPNY